MKKNIYILMFLVAIFVVIVSSIFIYTYTPIKCEYPTGKDTVAVLGNGRFQIGKTPRGRQIEYHFIKNGVQSSQDIVRYVSSYRQFLKKVYIKADDGYAVVNAKDNTCKLFLLEENKMAMGFTEIQYLSKFEEFTEVEQQILNSLN